jgi:hypothetical protein
MERPQPSTKGKIITFGSVKEKELPIILPLVETLRQNYPQYDIYVVPRELTLIETIFAQLARGMAVTRYSIARDKGNDDGAVVVVDTVEIHEHLRRERACLCEEAWRHMADRTSWSRSSSGHLCCSPHIENFRRSGRDPAAARYHGVGRGAHAKDRDVTEDDVCVRKVWHASHDRRAGVLARTAPDHGGGMEEFSRLVEPWRH